jgi:hypothetical protein
VDERAHDRNRHERGENEHEPPPHAVERNRTGVSER